MDSAHAALLVALPPPPTSAPDDESLWLRDEAAHALADTLVRCDGGALMHRARSLSPDEPLGDQEVTLWFNALEDVDFVALALDYGVAATRQDVQALVRAVMRALVAAYHHASAPAEHQQDLDAEESDTREEWLEPGECPICHRIMPLTFHHLYPRAIHKKYLKRFPATTALYLHTTGIDICRPCHSHVHRTVRDHWELALHYNTLDKIMSLDAMQRWAAWASKQRSRGHTTRGLRYQR